METSSRAGAAGGTLLLRRPVVADGPAVWRMVRGSVLDTNSPYAYFMMFRYFPASCAVAELEGRVVGFVTGFCPRSAPDTLFVWQVGVDRVARGRGVGRKVIEDVLARSEQAEVRYIEATVGPGNEASWALFKGIARRLEAEMTTAPCFPEELFPGTEHEAELLLRIGPFGAGGGPNA